MKNNYLALGGLFAALHLLFLLLSKFVAGSEFILVVFLPLLSTIYALKFNVKESAMFFIATFFLCAIFEPVSTFIYILPALMCGSIYGVFRKRGMKELSLVYVSSLAHALSVSISFVFIGVLFKEVDFFDIFASFINKSGNEFYVCVYLVLLVLGVIEAFVTHIISDEELKKVGYKNIESEEGTPLWINCCLVALLILYLVLAIIDPLLTCYCYPFVLAFTIPNVVEFVMKSRMKWIYWVSGVLFVVSAFVTQYIDVVFYPMLIVGILFPMIVENFVRVLYTNSSKYSNNVENRIE